MTKNAMGAHEPFLIHFTVVPSVASFFINLVQIYPKQCDFNYFKSHSPLSQRNQVRFLRVVPVNGVAMASPIILKHWALISMFNVLRLWHQTSLPTKDMSTNLSSPLQNMNKLALVVILERTIYFDAPFVNLL